MLLKLQYNIVALLAAGYTKLDTKSQLFLNSDYRVLVTEYKREMLYKIKA